MSPQPLRKYPRTRHLRGSRLQPGDEDLEAAPFAEIDGRHLVVEEKLDGANAGVGFDADSNLWAVTYQDTEMPTPEGGVAFKIDPVTGVVIDFYNGLNHPYTYSDMTGKALGTVACPPAG